MNFDNRQKYRKQTGRQLNFDKKQTNRQRIFDKKKEKRNPRSYVDTDRHTNRQKTNRQTEG